MNDDEKKSELLVTFKEYAQQHDLGSVEVSQKRKWESLSLSLKSGRNEHQIFIPIQRAQKYLDIDFAQYKFFQKYYGIVSYNRGYFEAEIDFVGDRFQAMISRDRIFRRSRPRPEHDEPMEFQSIEFGESSAGEFAVSVGPASDEFRFMLAVSAEYDRGPKRLLSDLFGDSERGRVQIFTLKVFNTKVRQFSEAENLLRNISNSCFFILSREFNIDLILRSAQRQIRRRRIERPDDILDIPHHEYPPEAISFYRYGLSAREMPLLQFLAFYQVVEFFFNHYSLLEVQSLVVNRLKDPKFSPYNTKIVQDLINLVKSHRASDIARNERDQLKATLIATLHPQEIISWIVEDEDREDFFKTRNLYKKTSDLSVDVSKPDNIVNQLTDRIYDIRCKIVHTKASGLEVNFILPYSEEAIHLSHDIGLMREVAERVLIASSSELRVQTID